MWSKIILFLLVCLFPFSALANITVGSPTYSAPALVDYAGTPGNIYLYRNAVSSSPIAISSGAPPATGFINNVTWAVGSFNSSTLGIYFALEVLVTDCNGQTLAFCRANNSGMPGVSEAEFEIVTSSPPSSPISTSTMNMFDIHSSYQFIMLSLIMFLSFLYLAYWLYCSLTGKHV